MPRPKVAVVMNSYHTKNAHLREAINSYKGQLKVSLQLIVSTVKGDPAIGVALKKGVEVFVSSEVGIYTQLNNALPLVKGDWFAYASSNDVALLAKLKDEVKCCCESGKKVCYSSYHQGGAKLEVRRTWRSPTYNYRRHLRENFVSDVALMHIDILRKYAPFRVEYGNYAFWDFWLRVYEGEGDVFIPNAKPEWIYRITSASRHIRVQSDPKLAKKEAQNRARMLAAHR